MYNVKTYHPFVGRMAVIILTMLFSVSVFAAETQWIAIGDLHDWFHSDGCEMEVGRTHEVSDQQDGLRWPAQFRYQDSKAAKALWIGCKNFNDPVADKVFSFKVVHVGPRSVADEGYEFMTETFELWGKYQHPSVDVDGVNASKLNYMETIANEHIDPDLPAERVLYNVVHTSIGITMRRTIYGFSEKNNSNYFIYDYVFKNTGIIDLNGTTNPQTLEGVVFYFQFRYAPSREGGPYGYYWLPQSTSWGESTMNDVIYTHPQTGEPFRALISWLGKHSLWQGPGDNIGGPAYLTDGHYGAPQFVGAITLHADKSAVDKSDDPDQPSTTLEIDSDSQLNYNNDQYNGSKMAQEYAAMTAGRPAESQADRVGDGFADESDPGAGGWSATMGYGPYTLAPGDSIHIVYAEGVAGLDRQSCFRLGAQWLAKASPYPLPTGGNTTDRNKFKNDWVMTGRDSLIQTFERAKANWESDFAIPETPPPPKEFKVKSGGDKITLTWADNAEAWVGRNYGNKFAGYRVYRAIHQPDTTYELVFACGSGTDHPEIVNIYEDRTAIRGFNYHYYITAFDDGSTPDGLLESGKFYTMTMEPAYLRRPPGNSLSSIRIVPNPYNVRARSWQFGISGADRITFVNLPPYCEIKIYTERGDLIKTIIHDDASGDEAWNSITEARQVVVSGIYIVYFKVTQDVKDNNGNYIFRKGQSITKKLAIIR